MTTYKLTPEELARVQYSPVTSLRHADGGAGAQFIQRLTAVQRNALSSITSERKYAAGEVIFREGDMGKAIYIIRLGQVVIVKGTFESPTILGHQGLGSVLGEMAVLEGVYHSATVVATTNVRMMEIKRDDFLDFIKENPDINQHILASLSTRLREADKDRQQDTRYRQRQEERIDELIEQQEKLIAMQRTRSEMSDLIIHDLRNPLNLMHGAIQMLEMMMPEDVLLENQELIDIGTAASDRMQRLIDSLLDASRMEAGDIELQYDALNMRLVIQDIVTQMTLATQKRKIDVILDLPDDLPIAYADEAKISRTIANLIDNAIKFMPNGGKLYIAVTSQTAVTIPHLLVSITDTGPGIPEKARPHIFDRFSQVDTENKQSGFGLGLAFCRLAVEAHDGRIWIEDGFDGVGSRFNFTLPIND